MPPKPTDPDIVESDEPKPEPEPESDSDSDYESDKPKKPDSDSDFSGEDFSDDDFSDEDATPEENRKKFIKLLNSKKFQEVQDAEPPTNDLDEEYNFPVDPENWTEEDLMEIWGDAPVEITKTGWDPNWVSDDELEVMKKEIKAGRDPPIAPFYVPYRKYYPAVNDKLTDIGTPKGVIEELDRIEEFLKWVSFIFLDGSSYEGTVWDDLRHGKGVYIAEDGLVRYEGEWLQNQKDGHGVVEVDIPDIEPVPGSQLEEEMRAQGKIIARDYMSPEDREWLEMDIEDSLELASKDEIPFYENDEWIRQFGEKPEKGRYRYAGEWKHDRMHGCGVYEINDRTIYGRFYFGELMDEPYGCDADQCALHSGIAEVAAAKARMFMYKPDGMVREERGPYGDPQHHYFYEEEDVWMAPGFINQFFEVPYLWKNYVEEVDVEREMWLNSFYRSPLRLPMPAELSYWWENEEPPEFVLVNKEPEPDPEDPSQLVYTEDPLILHTPTGRFINYVEDEEYGMRLFWQPPLKEGEDVDPNKVVFLPLEDKSKEEKKSIFSSLKTKLQDVCKHVLEKIEKWTEEKKEDFETKIEFIEKEAELVDAEMELKEAIEDLNAEMEEMEEEEEMEEQRKMEKKAEKKNREKMENEREMEKGFKGKEDTLPSEPLSQSGKTVSAEVEEDSDSDSDEDDDEKEEDEGIESSFGSVIDDQDSTKNDQKGNQAGSSLFAASSLSFATRSLVSMVPSQLQLSFSKWKEMKSRPQIPLSSSPPSYFPQMSVEMHTSPRSNSFPRVVDRGLSLRAVRRTSLQGKPITKPHLRNRSIHKESTQSRGSIWHGAPPINELNLLSLHTPIDTSLL